MKPVVSIFLVKYLVSRFMVGLGVFKKKFHVSPVKYINIMYLELVNIHHLCFKIYFPLDLFHDDIISRNVFVVIP